MTQLFFDNEVCYRFLDLAEKAGITVPITCGIMPFMSRAQISRMVFMCGASLPSPVIKLLAKYEDDPRAWCARASTMPAASSRTCATTASTAFTSTP